MTETSREVCVEELIDEIAMGPFGSNIKADCFVDSGVPVFNGSNLVGFETNDNTLRFVTQEKAKSLGNALASRGDVVVTHRGTLGQIAMIPYDSRYPHYVISQSQFRIRCNNKVLPKFLVYYFHTREGQWRLLSNKVQTGVPALGRPTSTFRKLSMPLPAIETQVKIVQVLDAMQAKIEANAKLNGYLEELVDALFCEMVLGAVDSSKTVSFSSFLEERKEKCPSRTNAEYSVTDTGIHPRSLKFRKNLSATSSKNKIARKDDLVFGISRRILNWGLFDAEIGEVSSAYRVYSISGVPPEYVARYIARYQCAFTDIIKPSSREGQGIMPDALMTKKLPKLNSFAWEKYLDTVAPIKALASITRTETAALLKSRDSILPKLMSGEIDVSKIDLAKLNSHLAER